MSEMNWETEELINWIINDSREWPNTKLEDIGKRWEKGDLSDSAAKAALRKLGKSIMTDPQFDLAKVDWESVLLYAAS